MTDRRPSHSDARPGAPDPANRTDGGGADAASAAWLDAVLGFDAADAASDLAPDDAERADFERLAASIAVADVTGRLDVLGAVAVADDAPAGDTPEIPTSLQSALRARAAQAAADAAASRHAGAPSPFAAVASRRSDVLARIGRIAAGFAIAGSAAAAVVIVALSLVQGDAPMPEGPIEARAMLMDTQPDVRLMRWRGTDHPVVRDAVQTGRLQGDVIWSAEAQAGFVRVCHLSINDPAVARYRVWVWTEEGADAAPRPVAIFDVAQAHEDTVIALEPNGPLGRVVRAVLTVEPPAATATTPTDDSIAMTARWAPPAAPGPRPDAS